MPGRRHNTPQPTFTVSSSASIACTAATAQPAFPTTDCDCAVGADCTCNTNAATCSCGPGEGCSSCCSVAEAPRSTRRTRPAAKKAARRVSRPTDDEEDEEDREDMDEDDEDETADAGQRAVNALKPSRGKGKKKAAEPVDPFRSSPTVEQVQKTLDNLAMHMSSTYRKSGTHARRVFDVIVPFMVKHIHEGIKDNRYQHLVNPLDRKKIRYVGSRTGDQTHYLFQRSTGISWNHSGDRYNKVMFASDTMPPSRVGEFNAELGVYPDIVYLWTALFVMCRMLEADHNTEWKEGELVVYMGALSRLTRWTSSSFNDDNDDEDDEDEDEGGSHYAMKVIQGVTYDTGRISGVRTIMYYRHHTALPFVIFRDNLQSEAMMRRHLSSIVGARPARYMEDREEYPHVMVRNAIIEGIDFGEPGGVELYPLEPDCFNECSDMLENSEMSCDFALSEFMTKTPHKETNVPYTGKPYPVVRVGRFWLSADWASTIAGVVDSLRPKQVSPEESLRMALAVQLGDYETAHRDLEAELTEARKRVGELQSRMARSSVLINTLETAFHSNLKEAMERVKQFNFEKVEFGSGGVVFIQTGPLFGEYSDLSARGKPFYIGNFQIVASMVSADLAVRNIAAPIIRMVGEHSQPGRICFHPHSHRESSKSEPRGQSKLCWGGYSSEIGRRFNLAKSPMADEFENRLRTLLHFLRTANKEDSYVSSWSDVLDSSLQKAPEVTTPTTWDLSLVTNKNVVAPPRGLFGVRMIPFSFKEIKPTRYRSLLRHHSEYFLATKEDIEWIS